MTKQFWTLENAGHYQTEDDVLSPHIRYPIVGEDRKQVRKGREAVYGVAQDATGNPIANPDHADFVAWLTIENHKNRLNNLPELKTNKRSVRVFMDAHPEYKLIRAFRKGQNTLAKIA